MASLLYTGLSASLLVGVAGLLRLCLGKKIPAGAFYLLWRLLVLRLLFPFSIPIPLPWLKPEPVSAGISTAARVSGQGLGHETPPLPQAPLVREIPLASGPDWAALAFWIWLIGAAVLAAGLLLNHLHWRRIYAAALPAAYAAPGKFRRKIRVRESDRIRGPLTYGLLRPVILLPRGTAPDALPYVLAHEAVHIRRLDNSFQWLLAAALCLHWINPLAWALVFFFRRDMELSCDEAVLRQSPACRKSYACALLAMEERHCPPFSAGFSKHPIKERIVSIMNFKPNTLPRIIIAAAAVAAVSLLSIATIFRPAPPQDVLAAPDASSSPSREEPSAPEESLPPVEIRGEGAEKSALPSDPEGSAPGETPVELREGESDTEPVNPPSSQENPPKITELPEGSEEAPPLEGSPEGQAEEPESQSLILPVSLTTTGHHHNGHHSEEGNWVSCRHNEAGHCGMDIACPTGTAVCAAGNGVVTFAGFDGNFGNCVVIDHGSGLQTRYGHNSQLLVSVGDTVSQGQQIAQSGSTGMATGPHCHFEVLQDGESCDPEGYCVF